jgi:hypothetical protein
MIDRAANIRNIKALAEYPKKTKRQEQEKEYKRVRRVYLIVQPLCECGCGRKSVEIHHSAGRVGKMLTDTAYFKALARSCHRRAHNDREWAVKNKLTVSRLKKA